MIDKLLTLLVNGGKGPRVSDGVDRPATPVSDVFPLPGAANFSAAGQARTGPCNRPSKQIRTATMTANSTVVLELDDIQAGALEPRPVPYAGVYQILRLDDRHAGRELLQRLIPYLNSVASFDPKMPVSLAVALSFQGLKALGVPEESLASFPPEFQQGMAARSAELGDVGENAPEHWEKPLGSQDAHLVVVGLAPDTARLEAAVRYARDALRDLSGVVSIWQQNVHAAADLRNMFGFADGIAHPAVEGTGIPGTNPHEVPLKAGEFVLGYEDETYNIPPIPQPEVLGRNGTYAVFRKLHTRVAAFRQYLHQRAKDRAEEEWLAAKIVGRWPSGAPLALAPDKDNPDLGADPKRNNAFMFGDDPHGLKSPFGSHVRRMNPRDSAIIGAVRLHRMIRRGHQLWPAAARRRPGGRWRRPRSHIRLCRGAP